MYPLCILFLWWRRGGWSGLRQIISGGGGVEGLSLTIAGLPIWLAVLGRWNRIVKGPRPRLLGQGSWADLGTGYVPRPMSWVDGAGSGRRGGKEGRGRFLRFPEFPRFFGFRAFYNFWGSMSEISRMSEASLDFSEISDISDISETGKTDNA